MKLLFFCNFSGSTSGPPEVLWEFKIMLHNTALNFSPNQTTGSFLLMFLLFTDSRGELPSYLEAV